MRLAYLTSRYPAASHVFMQREVRGLRDRGVDIDVVSVRRSTETLSDLDREEAARTLWLVPARPLALLRAALAILRHPAAAARALTGGLRDAPSGRRFKHVLYWGEAVLLWDMLSRRRISHLHVHFANNASDIALLATRLGRASGRGPRSFSLHLHGPTDFYDVERNRIGLKGREASGIICISDFARSQALAHLPADAADTVHVARYGGPPRVAPRGPRAPGPLRILNVGRLAPVKGQAVLLDALATLAKSGVLAELDVVGDGPLRDDLLAVARDCGVADRVRFHGALAYDAVSAMYARADVFCLPSFAEGLPVVLLEAMAHGVPVVATRIMGVPEAIRHGEEGLLVAPARPDALAEALARLLTDEQLRVRLGAAGRTRIATELSHEESIDQIERALRKVMP